MEKILFHSSSSSDQSISAYKQNGSKTGVPMMVQSSENYAPSINHGGILYAPHRSLSYSFSSQQPPLLPLPITNPYNNINSRSRGLSCPPKNRRINNKSKPSITGPKKDGSTVKRLGPDPKDLPKVVCRDLSSSASHNINIAKGLNDNSLSSDSVMFNISPPPSSLPLPTFFLRPRLSCKAEAAEVDAGATDSLRRLLRLR